MPAIDHYRRLHMIERHAANSAREARNCIECMPSTHSNFAMVLDSLIAEAERINWAEDTSDFIEHLQAASAALDKLYAPKEEQA